MLGFGAKYLVFFLSGGMKSCQGKQILKSRLRTLDHAISLGEPNIIHNRSVNHSDLDVYITIEYRDI